MKVKVLFQKFLLLCILIIYIAIGLNGQTAKRPSDNILRSALLQPKQEMVLTANDLNYELTDYYTSKKSGVEHAYLRQTYLGLEVIGTESSVHILPDGKVLSVSNKFVSSIMKRADKAAAAPKIDAVQAVRSTAQQLGYNITKELRTVSMGKTADRKSIISDGGFSLSNIPIRLMYYLKEDGTLELIWDLSIESINKTEWYNVRISAETGKIIDKINWVSSCNFGLDHQHELLPHIEHNTIQSDLHSTNFNPLTILGSYNVFAMPLESPYYGDRTLLNADDIVDLNASPFGWHDTDGISGPEYQTTRGNNVNAYEDGNNPGFQPDGGSNLIFDFPFDSVYSNGNQSESAAITNLFYWNNIIHDVFYEYGFDEPGGNFQQNNYGNGGLGVDYVRAEAQDGSGTCNANFATPPDGQLPRMQMYICGSKDGDFDNLVIVHEYGHGISNRLTGGPSTTSCLSNQEQMGEGWSDFFGLMMTMDSSDMGPDSRGVGTYLFGQGPNGYGIRTYPYSTDMNINPHTYDAIKTEVAPHGVGSVWCAMLWEMTWELIDEYGFDPDIYNGTGGNNMALNLVVEGLKLQPCSPGFVDGRNAILLADQMLYGGANQCLIWDAFAKRGLGYSANQGSSTSKYDGTQAFDSPYDAPAFVAPADLCLSHPILFGLSGGTPFGGVYSGPGVTDDGNGATYSFDPLTAGIGIHTITYSVPASACGPASTSSDDIEVTIPLTIDCPADIQVTAPQGECEAIVTYNLPIFNSTCGDNVGDIENFDTVSAPLFPTGWNTTTDQGTSNNWLTVISQSSSAPNSAFAMDLNSVSLSSLTSPTYDIWSDSAKLLFNLFYNIENTFDGVVLEYSKNGGPWSDILSGGGTFISIPYNSTLSTSFGNPLGGRQAWTGNSAGFKNVKIGLNPTLNGESVQFRWRMGSDNSVGVQGVWLDNVQVDGSKPPASITQTAGLPSGSYFPVGTTVNSFSVENLHGDSVSCSFNVIVDGNGSLSIDATATPNPICVGDTLNLSVTAGDTYSWTGPDGFISSLQNPVIANIQTNQAGTYYVTVTSSNCTSTGSVSVTVNQSLTVTATATPNPICLGSTLNLGVTAGDSYSWTGPDGFTSSVQNPIIFNFQSNQTGTYYVTVTSSTGCTGTSSVSVTSSPSLIVTASATPNPICSGGTLNLGVTAGDSYSWTGPDGFTSNIQNPLITNIQTNQSGTYFVTVTSSSGCTGTSSVSVTVNPVPPATVTATPNPLCAGETLNLGTTSGASYSWTGPDGFTSNVQNPVISDIQTSQSGTYAVTVTSSAGCIGVGTVDVTVNPAPDAVATPSTQTICSGNLITTIVLSSSANGATFDWTRDNTSNVTGIATSGSGNISGTLTNNTNTIQTVVFTISPTANDCAGTPITATVTVKPAPDVIANPTNQTICSGYAITTIVLTGSVGGSTFDWTRDNTSNVTGIATSGSGNISGTLTNNTNTIQLVTFTITPTANGCGGTPITATVTVNPEPHATASPYTQTICSGSTIQNIALTSSVVGTTFNWTRNNTVNVTGIASSGTGNISGSLTNTTYTIQTVTFTITPTANGCVGYPLTATVTVNPTPDVTPTPSDQEPCSGKPITPITMSGQVSGTTFLWTRDMPQITGIALSGSGTISGTLTNNGNAPVTVTFTITPWANGCAGTPETATVTVYPSPHAVAEAAPNPACEGELMWFNATGGVQYHWSGPGGFTNDEGRFGRHMELNMAGTYYVTVTNSNGCTSTASISVSVKATPVPTISISPNPACTGNTVQLSATGGTSYNWSGPNGFTSTQQNPVITNVNLYHTGTYTVTVTGANSCTASVSTDLRVNQTPVGKAWFDTKTACTGSTLQLYADGGGTYQWTGPAGFSSTQQNPTRANLNSTHSGIYTVVITGLYGGCTSSYSVNVQVHPLPAVTAWTTTPEVCEGDAAYLFASGGSTYQWTGPYGYQSSFQNPIVYNIPAYMDGIYTVTASSEYGCTATSSVYIDVQTVNAIVNATPNPVPYGGTLYLTASGGTFYQWTGPNGFYSYQQNPVIYKFTLVNAGLYSCVVSTNIGCQDTEIILVQVKNQNAQDEPQLETRSGRYVQAFPNPAKDVIRLDDNYAGIMDYTILNTQGDIIQQGKTTSGDQISIDQLNAGSYYIQWTYTVDGKLQSNISKFIKVQ